MKQLLIKSGEVFLKEVPAPTVGSRNILVRVRHSCVSVGTEMAGIRMSALPLYRRALKQPHHAKKVIDLMRNQGIKRTYDMVKGRLDAGTPAGYSAAGEVVATGDQVDEFKIGDIVACAGAGIANHAELIDVPVNLAARIPDGLATEHASTVTLGAIAMQGVRRIQPNLGETVVVIGLGILGQIGAQLLSRAGCRVIGTDVDPKRIAAAMENGMDVGLKPGEGNVVDRIVKLTDGFGADAVLITAASSSHEIISDAFKACRRKARVVLVGDVGLNIDRNDMYMKELDFLISTSYGPGRYDPVYEEEGRDYPLPYVRWTENRNMAEYLRLLGSGKLRLDNLPSKVYAIEDAPAAYQVLSAEGEKPLLVILSYPEREEASHPTIRIAPTKPTTGRIGIALVGAGGFAQSMHLPNLLKLKEGFELRSVVSRTGATARMVADRFGATAASTEYESVLSDPDIQLVLIATRHNLHAGMALAALRAGKHVFVEKPLAITAEEANAIERFYETNPDGPLLMTGFNRRFSPAVIAAKRLLVGRTAPMIVNYRMNAGYISGDHWVHGAEGGGRNIGEACHIYDLFSALTESLPVEVKATSVVPESKYWRRNDNFVATVRYADGSVCTLTYTAMGHKSYPKERAEIFCDGNVLFLDDYKSLTISGKRDKGWSSMTIEKGQLEELQALLTALRQGGPWPISLEDQLATTRLSLEVEDQL